MNKIYEHGSFDKYGNLNGSYFLFNVFAIFIITFLLSVLIINYNKVELETTQIIYLYKQYFKDFYYSYNHLSLFSLLEKNYKYLIIPFLLVSIYIFKIIKMKMEQRKLANFGLEDYYLYKKLKNGAIYKVIPGAIMEYDKFLKQFENMIQRNNKGSCEIQRYKKDSVKVIYKNKIPSIKELAKEDVRNYLQKGKLFLGFAGGVETKKDAVYVDFKDLPHSFALLGTSGGGKSNSLNHILYSVFYNFRYVYELNFIDFKGGIESEPYSRLESKYKTNKINTFTTSRFELYKKMVELDIINKARQLYLKEKGFKKFNNKYIYVFLDEIAEILDYNPQTKEEKEQHLKTKDIIESLFRTGRSQGFKLFYATQIFTTVGSGISNSIKNNTIFRILHKTESDEGINAVIDKEPLEERGINPKTFTIGEVVIKNESEYYHCRSLYVPDNFIDNISIKKYKQDEQFEKEMTNYIDLVLKDYNLKDLTKEDLFNKNT